MAAAPHFQITDEIKLGGEGGWDYLAVDTSNRRLYVSHGTQVDVVDVQTAKAMGKIPDTAGVHGITFAPDLNKGFISDGRANDVTVFDLKSLAVLSRVKTGTNPDAIQFDPVSGRVFTFNGRSNDITAIAAKTGQVEGTIPVGGKPEFAQADGKGHIYFNIEDKNEIGELDTNKMVISKRYSLQPCDGPSGLAMDVKNRRLFSVCESKIMAISDPDAGKVIATVPIGGGADGAAFDPGTGLAFSSNGEGTLTVVGEKSGKWAVVENATTKRGARTIALDPKSHTVYLPTAEFGATPAATAQNARPRPSIQPGTFEVLVLQAK